MISGTNGLMGAADGAFLLYKEKRTGLSAVLEISGRDQPDQKMHLTRDLDSLAWKLDKVDVEYCAPRPEPLLEAIVGLVNPHNPDWHGTATELLQVIGSDIPLNSITKRLNINAGRLLSDYQIFYQATRNRDTRQLEFHYIGDDCDGCDGVTADF